MIDNWGGRSATDSPPLPFHTYHTMMHTYHITFPMTYARVEMLKNVNKKIRGLTLISAQFLWWSRGNIVYLHCQVKGTDNPIVNNN